MKKILLLIVLGLLSMPFVSTAKTLTYDEQARLIIDLRAQIVSLKNELKEQKSVSKKTTKKTLDTYSKKEIEKEKINILEKINKIISERNISIQKLQKSSGGTVSGVDASIDSVKRKSAADLAILKSRLDELNAQELRIQYEEKYN